MHAGKEKVVFFFANTSVETVGMIKRRKNEERNKNVAKYERKTNNQSKRNYLFILKRS